MSTSQGSFRIRRAFEETWADCRHELGTAASLVSRMAAVVHGAAAFIRVLGSPAAALGPLRAFKHFGPHLKQATRRMRRSPGFTTVAVLTLALGIGANTAIFGLFNSVFLKVPPLPGIDRLVIIHEAARPENAIAAALLPVGTYRRLVEEGPATVREYSATALWHGAISGAGRAEPIMGEMVSHGYFNTLGLRPQVGTLFPAATDFDPAPAIVISDRLWALWFRRDLNVVGQAVRLSGVTVSIAGVAPRDFVGVFMPTLTHSDVWIPLGLGDRLREAVKANNRWGSNVRVLGRLTDRADPRTVDLELRTFAGPDQPAGLKTSRITAGLLPEDLKTIGMSLGQALTGLALLVLLIACANFAGLQLARGLGRAGELSIRRACGASRAELVGLLLTETAAIVGLAVVGGLAVAWALTRALGFVTLPTIENTTLRLDLSLDVRTFLFATLSAVIAALAVGLIPALRASRLQESTNAERVAAVWASGRLRRVLLAGQFAAATVLLLVAGLYARSAGTSVGYHPGFETAHLATATVDLRLHSLDETQGRRFQANALRAIAAIPGVERVTMADFLPLDIDGGNLVGLFTKPAGERPKKAWVSVPGEAVRARMTSATPGLIEMIQIPVLRGRSLSEADARPGAPAVVVLSERSASTLFPGQDPIGQRIAVQRSGSETWAEVVGITRQTDVGMPRRQEPGAFMSLERNYSSRVSFYASGAQHPGALAAQMEGALRTVDPDVAITAVGGAGEHIALFLLPIRVAAAVLVVLGAVGIGIAVVGLYATAAFFVAARTREIGVRVALGATPGDVRQLVVRQGMWPLIGGGAVGFAGSYAAAGLLRSLLFGITPHDPLTFVTVPLLLLVVGIGACLGPARRAARVDPNVSLRHS